MALRSAPTDLVTMFTERRVIPFIGAGFSRVFNMPSWLELLESIARDADDELSFAQVKEFCNADPLQIAEYYYLKSGRRIGPLRHAISSALSVSRNCVESGIHVELVNLHCPQVYTTNYDDIIEKTYRALGERVEVVSLPQHVATAYGSVSQVVKYHGDLRHETTLVLTESSYYQRLDFESPMDLKFRSDLLGKSVLFMGYSFTDINIRVIWFKLLQMMKDIPESDRPKSYIVRFEPNPVLELLYESVGIETILLDPDHSAKEDGERTRMLERFMLDLVEKVHSVDREKSIGGTQYNLYYSAALANEIDEEITRFSHRRRPLFESYRHSQLQHLLEIAGGRHIPPAFAGKIEEHLQKLAESFLASANFYLVSGTEKLVATYSRIFGGSRYATYIALVSLARENSRNATLESAVHWPAIWECTLTRDQVVSLHNIAESEKSRHVDGDLDYDLAYLIDICRRFSMGQLVVQEFMSDAKALAEKFLSEAAEIYPSVESYVPEPSGPPAPEAILSEIRSRIENKNTPAPTDDELPF